jgi:hypothetical protein
LVTGVGGDTGSGPPEVGGGARRSHTDADGGGSVSRQWHQVAVVESDGVAAAKTIRDEVLGSRRLLGTRGKFRIVVQNFMLIGYTRYICRLTDEYTVKYILRLTDEYSGLHSAVETIFLDFSTEKYSSIIFFGTEEYNKTEKYSLFSIVTTSTGNKR